MSKKKNSCGVYAQQAEREAREMDEMNRKAESRAELKKAVEEAERRGEAKAKAACRNQEAAREKERRWEQEKRKVKAIKRLIWLGCVLLGLSVGVFVGVWEGGITPALGEILQWIVWSASLFLGGCLFAEAKRK